MLAIRKTDWQISVTNVPILNTPADIFDIFMYSNTYFLKTNILVFNDFGSRIPKYDLSFHADHKSQSCSRPYFTVESNSVELQKKEL